MLSNLELGRYTSELKRQHITGSDLAMSTDEDLAEVGVELRLHRKRLLLQIGGFRTNGVPASLLLRQPSLHFRTDGVLASSRHRRAIMDTALSSPIRPRSRERTAPVSVTQTVLCNANSADSVRDADSALVPAPAAAGDSAPVPAPAAADDSAPVPAPAAADDSAPLPAPAAADDSAPLPAPAAADDSAPLPGPAAADDSAPVPAPAAADDSAPLPAPAAADDSAPLPAPAAADDSAPLPAPAAADDSAPLPAPAVAGKWEIEGWLESLQTNAAIAEVLQQYALTSELDALDAVRKLAGSHEACIAALAGKLESVLIDKIWAGAKALVQSHAATGRELQSKFVQDVADSKGGFEMAYGDLATFFTGLEGLIGSPSPRVHDRMRDEHCHSVDSTVEFTSSSYGIASSSTVEWYFVADPTGEKRIVEDNYEIRKGTAKDYLFHEVLQISAWPKEPNTPPEKQRTPTVLKAFKMDEINAQLAASGDQSPMIEEELIGGRLYTGPLVRVFCLSVLTPLEPPKQAPNADTGMHVHSLSSTTRAFARQRAPRVHTSTSSSATYAWAIGTPPPCTSSIAASSS